MYTRHSDYSHHLHLFCFPPTPSTHSWFWFFFLFFQKEKNFFWDRWLTWDSLYRSDCPQKSQRLARLCFTVLKLKVYTTMSRLIHNFKLCLFFIIFKHVRVRVCVGRQEDSIQKLFLFFYHVSESQALNSVYWFGRKYLSHWAIPLALLLGYFTNCLLLSTNRGWHSKLLLFLRLSYDCHKMFAVNIFWVVVYSRPV